MKIGLLCVALLFAGLACSDKPKEALPPASPTPPPAAAAAAPTPPPAAATVASFAGSCTVTVAGTVVCTDYNGNAAKVQEGCTKSASGDIKTSFAAGRCPTAALVGKCSLVDGSINYYYQPSPVAAMQTACSNSKGTWANP